MEQDNTNVGGSGNGRSSSYLCRQSSTRWIPTTDQIRILKDLYYNNGLRSPNADQIQRISARLRQYGKIEGKNVFYWFQNHKARERQKKRLTVDINSNKFNTNMSSTGISPTSPVFYGLGQMGGSTGGAMLMERSYRESGAIEGNMGWVEATAVPQFYYQSQQRPGADYYYEENYYYNNNHQQQQQEEEKELVEIETLPLFPIHSNQEHHHHHHQQCYFQPYCLDQQRKEDTSLELTLNSYYSPHGSS